MEPTTNYEQPVQHGELLARLRAARRRSSRQPTTWSFIAGICKSIFQPAGHGQGQEIKTDAHGVLAVRLLVRNAGQGRDHRQILKEVWGPYYGNKPLSARLYGHLRRNWKTTPAALSFC